MIKNSDKCIITILVTNGSKFSIPIYAGKLDVPNWALRKNHLKGHNDWMFETGHSASPLPSSGSKHVSRRACPAKVETCCLPFENLTVVVFNPTVSQIGHVH